MKAVIFLSPIITSQQRFSWDNYILDREFFKDGAAFFSENKQVWFGMLTALAVLIR